MQVIEIDQFLSNKNDFPVLDTRSPGEHAAGHIPGAVNLPLFDNDQRAIIGTIYKEEGREKAIKVGLKLIGPKLVVADPLLERWYAVFKSRLVARTLWF